MVKSKISLLVRIFWVAVCLSCICIVPCKGKQSDDEEKIGVMVTILPLAYFVEEIGGAQVHVTVMVPPGGDPHTYEPTPLQMNKLSKADLYVKVGSGIEFELAWMDKLIALNKKMKVCDASKGIHLIAMDEHEHEGEGNEEHHHHSGKDPHVWLSLNNAIIMAGNIKNALIEIDPQNKDYYSRNNARLVIELDELKKQIEDKLAALKNRAFLIFHPAWGYFAADFNLIQIPVEISGKEPTPKQLNMLIKQARDLNIKVLFASPQFSKKSADVIANEINGKVLMLDPLSKDYIKNLNAATQAFVESMQ